MNDCFKYFEVQKRIPTPQQLKDYYEEQRIGKYQTIEDNADLAEATKPLTFWEVFEEFVRDNGIKNAWTTATYQKFAALQADLR